MFLFDFKIYTFRKTTIQKNVNFIIRSFFKLQVLCMIKLRDYVIKYLGIPPIYYMVFSRNTLIPKIVYLVEN